MRLGIVSCSKVVGDTTSLRERRGEEVWEVSDNV